MAKKKDGNSLVETVKTVAWALVIAGVFRTLFFQPFWIPSGSMKDTLLIGDFLFVNKMAYGYSEYSCPFSICPFIEDRWLFREPKRGDVVVFRHPANGQDYIKRLIGLPGDTVQFRRGGPIINGELVPRVPAGTFVEIYEQQGPIGSPPRCRGVIPIGLGGNCEKDRLLETLPNGVEYSTLDIIRGGIGDNTRAYTVPPENYFFVGDNRDNSQDSRFREDKGGIGFVHKKYLIGRADRVVFSSSGRSMFYFWTWRPDRFLKAVR